MTGDLLSRVLDGCLPAYALVYRPNTGDGEHVEVLTGEIRAVPTVADIPLRTGRRERSHDVLAVIPYRQIAERGYACRDDHEPLLTLIVDEQELVALDRMREALPAVAPALSHGRFDQSEDEYADDVRSVIDNEIATGEGANFVIRRSFLGELAGYSPAQALSLFRRLLTSESGSHWTFLIHTGDRTFVGASPERHISVDAGTAVMNPISGTYRYPPEGATVEGLLGFLADGKERDELSMVLDEELKVMGRICAGGGRVHGPYLREMARLAHSEYFIAGPTDHDPRDILWETMFAPTVVGSPLENACRVIARHEKSGRGYYSGVAALIGRDTGHGRDLDSAILIRTAEISATGRLRISAGATLVRHSDAHAETAETETKIAALLSALRHEPDPASRPVPAAAGLVHDNRVRGALARRNDTAAQYWFAGRRENGEGPGRVIVVDAEDTFTSMLGHQLRSLGWAADIRRYDEEFDTDAYDLVVLGPGPGAPDDHSMAKIRRLRRLSEDLVRRRRPFLAVCLSHQVLSAALGLPVRRRPQPHQGIQLEVEIFGRRRAVGFYNAFAAYSTEDKIETPAGDVVEVSRDAVTGEVYALRAPAFASLQFHPESILSRDGMEILAETLAHLAYGRSPS
ncbi:anthranilate synthase family protein [Actinoplanes utahensis]|uniref:anthranilate synthase n=1 Tax=Actinoplanes utahensis TaxID=1869 RepID=A0A0A6UR20_ACTUT|nr:chorismate-binding protein [Actinoplanes utahensis]KHD76834.1 anthranilate synthase [Actinoplanes utahensis]GIF33421.1 putative phenazine biosynthesis protein PhzE [Actinoplanes utahensis]